MQQKTPMNDILSQIAILSFDDQVYIADIVNHRINEQRRNQLANRINEAETNYAAGNVTAGTAEDLFAALDDD
jgi:hypothetical protein